MRVCLPTFLFVLSATASAAEPRVVGWLESVELPEAGIRVVAKLDTGAKTSSIDAQNVELFDRDGQKWARFGVQLKNGGSPHVFESRVVGTVKIRTAVGRDERPLVDLWICVAGERRRVLFSLGHRNGMNYRIILGRRALEGRLVVDSSRKFTAEPGCSGAK